MLCLTIAKTGKGGNGKGGKGASRVICYKDVVKGRSESSEGGFKASQENG